MKVAIVTIYDFFNHGNRLQNYALEKKIRDMGHEVETLLISPKKSYIYLMRFARLFPFISVVKRMNRSRKNTKEKMHTRIIDFCSKKKLKKIAEEYDAFVIGSDQVWNPKYIAKKHVSFLKFVDKDKCIAYAPSFGVNKLPKKYEEEFKDGISHIKYLSTREKSGVDIIKTLTGRDSELVVDPTLLLTKNEWKEFECNVKNKPAEYMLTYFLCKNNKYTKIAKKIAKKNKLKILNVNNIFDKHFKDNPSEFVNLIDNAKLVCSSSFHGNVFSIILEKPFISFPTFKSTSSRIQNIFKKTNLESRKYEKLEPKDFFNMDFSFAKNVLEEERAKSLKYLKDSLEDIKKNYNLKDRAISIKDKKDCCGCHACVNICPQKCISMEYDEEGFLYPKIDKKKCINCGLCKSVCPILNKKVDAENDKLPKAYAAYNKDLNVRLKSSSGGIFSLIAEQILNKNGVVFGAGFNEKFEVVHMYIENMEDLEKLRVSKYVQSRIGNTYIEAKKFLDEGRPVLFTGTNCQIEGLLSFLKKPYENLFTQDIICHGVPSPKVWEDYIKYREKKANSKIKKINFRKKIKSWKRYSFSFIFKNGEEYVRTPFYKDPMVKLFCFNKCLRPSCHECAFKQENRNADITLADFWGIQHVKPKMNDGKGISLVLVHTKKGEELFSDLKDKIEGCEVEFKKATKHNPMVRRSARPFQRKSFMKAFKTKPFDKVIEKYGGLW